MHFVLLIFFVILPHGELTGAGESGVNPESWQDPAVEDKPGGQDDQKRQ